MARRTRAAPAPRQLHTLHLQMASPLESLSSEERHLRSRIQEIERLLREAPEIEHRRRRIKRITIPPPENGWAARSQPARPNSRRLTKLEHRALARERWRHVLISGGLVTLLIGLLGYVARILQS